LKTDPITLCAVVRYVLYRGTHGAVRVPSLEVLYRVFTKEVNTFRNYFIIFIRKYIDMVYLV
jgi:hypothetical protein